MHGLRGDSLGALPFGKGVGKVEIRLTAKAKLFSIPIGHNCP
jgi:hypothetical protein